MTPEDCQSMPFGPDLLKLDRLGIKYNILSSTEYGFWINRNKKAKKSWGTAVFAKNPITWLNTCEVCGKTSTPKKVHYRSGVSCWNYINMKEFSPTKDTLCMGCWNKLKPIVKRQNEAKEIKRLINKLLRESRKWQKSQTLAN